MGRAAQPGRLIAGLLGLLGLAAGLAHAQAAQQQVVYVSDPPLNVIDGAETAHAFVIGFSGAQDHPRPPQGPHRVMTMLSANGTAYRCYIPEVAPAAEDSGPVSTAVEDSLLPQKTPTELLEALTGHCYYRIEDWWTYELCYGKALRQYHKEGEAVEAQYVLGRWDAAQPLGDEVQLDASDVSGAGQYVAHQYGGGDTCELSGQPRQAEVRFTCGGGAGGDTLLTSVREPSSCTYVVTITTPRLCKHPAFREQPVPASLIQCHALGLGGGAGACAAADAQQGGGACPAGAAAEAAPLPQEPAAAAEAVVDASVDAAVDAAAAEQQRSAAPVPDSAPGGAAAAAAAEDDADVYYDDDEDDEEPPQQQQQQAQQPTQAAEEDDDDPYDDE